MVKILGLMEIHQVLVVSKDLDGKQRSVEIVPPGFHSVDDGEELSVVDVIIPLGGDE